jgi:hypothetical protein
MDNAALIYKPIYETFGVSAVLTAIRPEPHALDVTVIERTTAPTRPRSSTSTPSARAHSSAGTRSTKLALRPQSSTAARSSSADAAGGSKRTRPGPGPDGEASGEILMHLTEAADA